MAGGSKKKQEKRRARAKAKAKAKAKRVPRTAPDEGFGVAAIPMNQLPPLEELDGAGTERFTLRDEEVFETELPLQQPVEARGDGIIGFLRDTLKRKQDPSSFWLKRRPVWVYAGWGSVGLLIYLGIKGWILPLLGESPAP